MRRLSMAHTVPVSNPFQVAGRLRKAFALACLLRRSAITSEKAALMTQAEWDECAKSIGQHPPSLETQRTTVEKMGLVEVRLEESAV